LQEQGRHEPWSNLDQSLYRGKAAGPEFLVIFYFYKSFEIGAHDCGEGLHF